MSKSKNFLPIALLPVAVVAYFGLASSAYAGGCAPGQECWEEPVRRAPKVTRPATPEKQMEAPADVAEPTPEPLAMIDEDSDAGSRFGIAAGVNVLYFDCEETEVAPGIFVDYQPSADLPINLRLGVEGTSVGGAEQFRFREDTAFTEDPDFTLVRIPLSIEHITEISEDLRFFIGGGPELIDVSDDVDDTLVGLHLGARVQQQFTDSLGVSVGAGYIFAEADDDTTGEEVDLDSAFTGVHLTYGF